MDKQLNHICAEGVSLLRNLSRSAHAESDARAQFESFRSAYPGLEADLVMARSSDPENIDYDLLIEDPAGATVCLSWRPHDGLPWTVRYAEHWSATVILTVGRLIIRVQDALLLFKLVGDDESDLSEKLLRYALIQQAIDEAPPPVSPWELQSAADRFRQAKGLLTADATREWLQEVGLTPQAIEKFSRQLVQTRKLRKTVTRGSVRSYFEGHAEEFDTVRLFKVEVSNMVSASAISVDARNRGLLSVIQDLAAQGLDENVLAAQMERRRLFELTPAFLKPSKGAIVGPVFDGKHHIVAEVLDRKPATFDSETRSVVEDRLFNEWLSERRRKINVRWYWT